MTGDGNWYIPVIRRLRERKEGEGAGPGGDGYKTEMYVEYNMMNGYVHREVQQQRDSL